jgi:hypothetical protein
MSAKRRAKREFATQRELEKLHQKNDLKNQKRMKKQEELDDRLFAKNARELEKQAGLTFEQRRNYQILRDKKRKKQALIIFPILILLIVLFFVSR